MAYSKNVQASIARLNNCKRCCECDAMLYDHNGMTVWSNGIPQIGYIHVPTGTLRCSQCYATRYRVIDTD